ncbi:MAG: hypothetical protein LBE59_01345, partial [Nevskiaceae bacterium]|nr:hypothetical protein [Nevskiaceae bacterium]
MDAIEHLLRQAGRRALVPEDAAARIRAQVHAQWMAGVQQRRRQRWMALAACVAVLAVGAVLALGGLTGRQR